MLAVKHNAGFLSCCSVRLQKIIEWYNANKRTPIVVDSSAQFESLKTQPGDITYKFFRDQTVDIPYTHKIRFSQTNDEDQFSDFRKIIYSDVLPFIDRYFTVSAEVENYANEIVKKYNIDLNNTCGVFFRGNDKERETNAPTYKDFIDRALKVKKTRPNVKFIVQSDETEFLSAFKASFPLSQDCVILEEIAHMRKGDNSVANLIPKNERIKHHVIFLALIKVLSKTSELIMTSGNCGMWICLYRRNADNIHQYLNRKEYIYGVKNTSFIPNQRDFWIGE